MKKRRQKRSNLDRWKEYDFSSAMRGKYARTYAEGANIVLLEPDVAKAFPTAKAVNHSLRSLIAAPRRQRLLTARVH